MKNRRMLDFVDINRLSDYLAIPQKEDIVVVSDEIESIDSTGDTDKTDTQESIDIPHLKKIVEIARGEL